MQAQAPQQPTKQDPELAALREQLGELAALAHSSAKMEGLPVPQQAPSDAAASQQVAATLRTILQVSRCAVCLTAGLSWPPCSLCEASTMTGPEFP